MTNLEIKQRRKAQGRLNRKKGVVAEQLFVHFMERLGAIIFRIQDGGGYIKSIDKFVRKNQVCDFICFVNNQLCLFDVKNRTTNFKPSFFSPTKPKLFRELSSPQKQFHRFNVLYNAGCKQTGFIYLKEGHFYLLSTGQIKKRDLRLRKLEKTEDFVFD